MTGAPYRMVRDKAVTGHVIYAVVRVSDGAVIAQAYAKGNAIVAPEHLRQQLARLNTKAILDEIL